MTIADAARRLGASPRTVYRLDERGILPIVRIDRDLPRVRESDLVRLIEGRGPGAAA